MITHFFNVTNRTVTRSNISLALQIDFDHFVFAGHFPNNPILPGVLELQIPEVILKEFFGCDLKLVTIKSARFLKSITPSVKNSYLVDIGIDEKEDFINSHVKIDNETDVFLQLEVTYLKILK